MNERKSIKANDIWNYSTETAKQVDKWLHVSGDLDDFIFYDTNNDVKDR
jgi:hypothetical protein